jgi:hypothetical protein
MAKRLQVILQDHEYREIKRISRARRMSIAEWIRQALELARREEPSTDSGKKLQAIRAAVQHEFPTGDIDSMLEEIERGYAPGSQA